MVTGDEILQKQCIYYVTLNDINRTFWEGRGW